MITRELLTKVSPNLKNADQWATSFSEILPQYEIESNIRIAAFLSQTAHESAGWTILKERLSYSKDGLLKVFRKYFNEASAEQYARNGPRIASRVYANRMGNGDEASGDGYKYCGRGIIMTTGKSGYESTSKALFGDLRLLDNPDLLIDPMYAIQAACWFWKNNNLNAIADTGDVVKMTKRINGGVTGLADRIKHYEKILNLL